MAEYDPMIPPEDPSEMQQWIESLPKLPPLPCGCDLVQGPVELRISFGVPGGGSKALVYYGCAECLGDSGEEKVKVALAQMKMILDSPKYREING